MQVVTKSGSKHFYGLGSYFERHEQFNAESSSGPFIQTPIVETPTIFYGTFQNLGSSAGLNFPQGVSGIDLNPKLSKAMTFRCRCSRILGMG